MRGPSPCVLLGWGRAWQASGALLRGRTRASQHHAPFAWRAAGQVESILKLVASIFEAPAALVALFDDRRIFIRDSMGAFARGDFPWRWSFCGWTMSAKNDMIMVIPDALKDYRFR